MIVETAYRREAEESAALAWREGMQWREKRKPSRWASEVRKIPAGTSPLSQGRDIDYDHAIMPHCVEQMDAADDPKVNTIVIWGSIRDGKTGSVCLNILGRTVTDDPGNIYSIHPTDADVHRFSNGDIEPLIESCLDGYFVEKKSRDTGRTVDFKKFTGGWLRIVNAGSPTKFRGTAVKVVFLHDADALDPEIISKALGRATGFSDAIKIIESTCTIGPTVKDDGTIEYNSNIHKAHDEGDRRKWFCKCRKCGFLQWLRYEQFQWPVGFMHKTRCLCLRCDYPHNESEWRKMVSPPNAQWFATAGLSDDEQGDIAKTFRLAKPVNPAIRSYWRNGFNSLLGTGKGYETKLHEFVAQGEAAKKNADDFKTWKNEVAAELWNPDEDAEPAPDWRPIFDRREDYATEKSIVVPKLALVLTCAIDVHKNRLEVLWEGWGRHEETWDLAHVVLPGEVQDPAVWKEAEQELQRTFQHELGGKIGLSFGLVDAGKWPDWVYWFLRHLAQTGSPIRGKVRACRGSSVFPHPVIDRSYKSLARNLKGHWIGPDAAKDLIYARLKLPEPQDSEEKPEGYRHYPQSFGKVFFEQLTIEQVRIQYMRGEELRRYDNKKNLRNETLDLSVYNLGAFRIRAVWPFDAIEKELTVAADKPKEKVEQKRVATPASRGGLGMGWNL